MILSSERKLPLRLYDEVSVFRPLVAIFGSMAASLRQDGPNKLSVPEIAHGKHRQVRMSLSTHNLNARSQFKSRRDCSASRLLHPRRRIGRIEQLPLLRFPLRQLLSELLDPLAHVKQLGSLDFAHTFSL